ncbi:CPBP family intramembrane metalloprotease [bacterium]|nr:CPBP family intramembrane metalloprotease [bacterium]
MSFIKSYFKFTRHGYYSIILIMPVFMIYETGIWWIDKHSYYKIRNFVDVILKFAISSIGVSAFFWVTVGAMLLLLFFLKPRNDFLFFHWSFLPVLFMESLLYVFAFSAIIFAYNKILFYSGKMAKDQIISLILSCGAGVYEEIMFRVILFGLIALLFRKFFNISFIGIIISAVISSLLFSAVHFIGEAGDIFSGYSFFYRFIGGLFFCLIYQVRGLAAAVYTHTIYDILVVASTV